MIRRFLKSNEDSLTSTVFSQLLHLPFECVWGILKEASFGSELPQSPGEPEKIEFWPNWNPEGTDNSFRVEPDLFFRFREFDLIIEAKRWDQGQQSRYQWEKELQAYTNEYVHDEKPVFMIALGGLHGFLTEQVRLSDLGRPACSVVMMQWHRVLQAVIRLRKGLEKVPFPSSAIRAQIRTLEHVVDTFSHHGFSTGSWYEDLPFYRHRLNHQCFCPRFQ
jgi:hypothetical protein